MTVPSRGAEQVAKASPVVAVIATTLLAWGLSLDERGVALVGEVPGGRMSTYFNSSVGVGDTLAVMPPLGSFVVPTDPGTARHHCLIAAGSGITPVLAHVENILRREPRSRVTLFFGNRSTR